jgi:predicted secreted hydrolase
LDSSAFDRLAKHVAASSLSRREALRRLSGAASAGAMGAKWRSAQAQDATPAAAPLSKAGAQAQLDALDPDTRDSLARALWLPELRTDDLSPELLSTILAAKNSNEAFGLRMGSRLLELINTPISFVPGDAEERMATLLPYCASLSPHQAYIMTDLIGNEAADGYRPVPDKADLQFPQANAMVLDSQVGWYFFVGSCTGSDGTEYGLELMFFRFALLPPALAAQFELSDTENQVMEMHLAVSKAGQRHYQAKPILIAGTSGLLSFSPDGLGATLGKNTIGSTHADDVFPLRIQAQGQDDGDASSVPIAIDLTFASGKGYLLQGADGCTPCCDGVGTIYYSIPNLQIDPAVSTLTLGQEKIELSSGVFWFDHQWGMLAALPQSAVLRAASNLQPQNPGGWDWFEAQFVGDRQITCAAGHTDAMRQFYFQTGPTPPDTMRVMVSGKYMDADGTSVSVTGKLAVTNWVKSEMSPAPNDYPPTNTWYPNRWEFQFGAEVPEDIRTFTMTPIVSSGQSGFFADGDQYAEGAVYLLDPVGKDIGRGFAESVAYADTLANQLRIVGIPVNDQTLTLFGQNLPSAELKLASVAYLTLHADELQAVSGTCIGLV